MNNPVPYAAAAVLPGPRVAPAAVHKALKPYRTAQTGRSVWQLASTSALYVALWALMAWSVSVHYGLTLLLSIPAAFMTVRFFIFSHDCGHGSFLASRRWNAWVGFVTGVLAYTPYEQWRHGHALHHARSGRMDVASVGYFWTMTTAEWRDASRWLRFGYRLYRFPLVLYVFGGSWLFLVQYRFTERGASRRARRSVWLTNLALAVTLGGLSAWLGWRTVLAVQLPIAVLAVTAGLWLFYVQHHYEGAQWYAPEDWDYTTAALAGSSHLDLPRWGHWLSGNIGYHHIHHLAPRIPNYRLAEAQAGVPSVHVPPLSFWGSFRGWRYTLIDAETGRWKTFADLRPRVPAANSALPSVARAVDGVADAPLATPVG